MAVYKKKTLKNYGLQLKKESSVLGFHSPMIRGRAGEKPYKIKVHASVPYHQVAHNTILGTVINGLRLEELVLGLLSQSPTGSRTPS